MNNTFAPAPAVREKAFALIGIAGLSNSGKTYSSLLLARGLVGGQGRICVLDTENRRSLHYADTFDFDVIHMTPPFDPRRYIEAIATVSRLKYDCLIIDSDSHEWDGEGGVVSMAEEIERRTGKSGLHCWAAPKRLHKKFVAAILEAQMHIICCSRARHKHEQRPGRDGKSEIVYAGLEAIQQKDFIFEMTVAYMLDAATRRPSVVKMTEGLEDAVATDAMITEATGAAIAAWCDAGEAVDLDRDRLLREARAIAADPSRSLNDWVKTLAKAEADIVLAIKSELVNIRDTAQAQAAMAAPDPEPDPGRDPFDESAAPPVFEEAAPAEPSEPSPGRSEAESRDPGPQAEAPAPPQTDPTALRKLIQDEIERAADTGALAAVEEAYAAEIAALPFAHRTIVQEALKAARARKPAPAPAAPKQEQEQLV